MCEARLVGGGEGGVALALVLVLVPGGSKLVSSTFRV